MVGLLAMTSFLWGGVCGLIVAPVIAVVVFWFAGGFDDLEGP
jgi:hypothetical protein